MFPRSKLPIDYRKESWRARVQSVNTRLWLTRGVEATTTTLRIIWGTSYSFYLVRKLKNNWFPIPVLCQLLPLFKCAFCTLFRLCNS